MYRNTSRSLSGFRTVVALLGLSTSAWSQPITIGVPGTAGRGLGSSPVSTGLVLTAGQGFTVDAVGQVSSHAPEGNYFDPDGEPATPAGSGAWMPAENRVALIAEVGGVAFLVGAGSASPFYAPASGLLLLGVNDNHYPDNGGAFAVEVTEVITVGGFGAIPNSVPSGGSCGLLGGSGISVPGTSGCGGFVATGIMISPGDTVDITATGCVRAHPASSGADPDGEANRYRSNNCLPTSESTALIGQIAGQTFKVGSAFSATALVGGQLLLGVNDSYYPDNRGQFLVTVAVTANLPAPDPVAEARVGNVNESAGSVTDALLINGSAGQGRLREVRVHHARPFLLTMQMPPAQQAIGPGYYALYAWSGNPDAAQVTPLSGGLGTAGIPLFSMTPFHLALAPAGMPMGPLGATAIGRSFYLQGLIEDPAAPNGTIAVTNGILLRVE
jgi:hypothetical protein